MSTWIVKSLQMLSTVLPRWAVAALAIAVVPAWGQTPVSGSITEDVQWTMERSPYVVSGQLVVGEGATLDIAPGVTVYMVAGASLSVEAGSLRAIGTADNPIQVLSDQVRVGQPALPGDFGPWTFTVGANDVRLEHLLFQYGSGIRVQGASPTFNYLDLRDNAGAAISIDLGSSPAGVGNRASGNGINGVEVPPGDITGSIEWGLLGIPYVVRSGVLSVGPSPTVVSVHPSALQQGEVATVEVVGTRLGGLVEAQFDREGIDVDVLPGATETRASFNVTVGSDAQLGESGLALLVDAGQVYLPSALTIGRAEPAITSLSPERLFTGQGEVQVEISGRGFSEDSSALLNGAVLTTAYVDPGHLNATIPNQIAVGELALQVRTPDVHNPGAFLLSDEFALPVLSPQIVITPDSVQVPRGATHAFNVEVPYPAAGGLSIDLVSSAPAVASVPEAIPVTEGERFAQFELTAIADGVTTITASHASLVSGQSAVTVVSAPALSIAPAEMSLAVGKSTQITISSSQLAGAGGLTVQLESSNTAAAQVTPDVTIAAGATTATATVTGVGAGDATLTASASNFLAGSAAVRVFSGAVSLPTGVAVAPGLSRSVELVLSDPAPAGGMTVMLASADPGIATVPASVDVPEGATEAAFQLTGVSAGTTTVVASAQGTQQAILPVTVDAIQLQLGTPVSEAISLPSQVTAGYRVVLSRPAPIGGVAVRLSTVNPEVAAVSPATITIAEGETSSGPVTANVSALALGSTTLVLESDGLHAVNIPVTVGNQASLRFSLTSEVVGKGLQSGTYAIQIQRRVDNQGYAGPDAVTVTLTSSDPTKVSVPETVSIQAGQSSALVPVTGVDLTGGNAVSITASADGYISPDEPVSVTTITPTVTFEALDLTRGSNSVRDDFNIALSVPGASQPTSGVAATDLVFDLSIVDASPADIVPGIYTAASGGQLATQVAVPAGQRTSSRRYIGTPTAMGAYRVRAQAAGIVDATSPLVNVSDRALRFSQTSEVVGKGLRNHPTSIYVERVANGQPLSGTEPLTVTLTSSAADRVSVPETVTIPAGQYRVPLQVTGREYTDGVPASISASADGYAAPATPLRVTAISPRVEFADLAVLRGMGSSRDDFRIFVSVPGAITPTGVVADADLAFDLSIIDASPEGIVPGFYDSITDGEMTSQIVIPAGQRYSHYRYVGAPTAMGSYRIHANAPNLGDGTSLQVVVGNQMLNFSLTAEVVGKGLRNGRYITYVQRIANGQPLNSSDPLVVTLTSSAPDKVSVPETVTIPGGAYQVDFEITGIDLTGEVPETISASADGFAEPASGLHVTTVTPTILFDGVQTSRSTESPRDDFRLRLRVPEAYAPDNVIAAADIAVGVAIADAVPEEIVSGIYDAPTDGQLVSQVTVAAGGRYSTWAYADTPTTNGTYRIRAEAPQVGEATSDEVTVASQMIRLSLESAVVGKGMRGGSSVYVRREVNGAPITGQPLTVSLASSDPGKVSVPETVTIPSWSSEGYFELTGVDYTGEVPVMITASAEGFSSPANGMSVTTVAPEVSFAGLDLVRGTGSGRDDFRVQLSVPGSGSPTSWVAVSPIAFDLSVVDASPENIVAGFYGALTGGGPVAQVIVPAGSRTSNYAYVAPPQSQGSYRVRVNASGLAEGTSQQVNVQESTLRFSRTYEVVGKGMHNSPSTIFVERMLNGSYVSESTPLTVTLTSSDPSKLSVPATVTIPAWDYRVQVRLTGVDMTDGAPVSIDASANGYASPENKITAHVVRPQVRFWALETARSVGGARDQFHIEVAVPTATNPGNVVAATPMTFVLSTADASPEGIVPGYYNAATGGSEVSQLVVPSGQRFSGSAYVGSPTTLGSYRVHASAEGISEATSERIAVGAASLRFTRTSEIVGKGTIANWSVYIQREVGQGQPLYDASPLTVTLTSSDPSKVSVPATVTIPSGSASVAVPLTGVDLTNGSPVTIDAVADGLMSPETKMSVTSVSPVVEFIGLSTERNVGGERDDFWIELSVPGTYASVQAAADIVFDLSILDGSPNGLIQGFYRASSGGEALTRLTVLAGQSYSGYAYVGSPTALGTYRVGLQAAGLIQAASDLVTVGEVALRFNRVNHIVGKGMRTSHGYVEVERTVNGKPFTDGSSITVTLTSSDRSKVLVPATVTIGSWSSGASIVLEGVGLTDGIPVEVDASAPGHVPPTSKLYVEAVMPEPVLRGVETLRSTLGASRNSFYVELLVPGAENRWVHQVRTDTTFDIAIVDPSPIDVVDGIYDYVIYDNLITELVVPTGYSSSNYAYIGVPRSGGTYRVRAFSPLIGEVVSEEVTVAGPSLRFSRVEAIIGHGMTHWGTSVQLVVGDRIISNPEPVTVSLTSSDATQVGVPESITIPAYSSSAQVPLTGIGLTAGATVTIDASAVGFASPAQTLRVVTVTPTIGLDGVDEERSPTSLPDDVYVFLEVPGSDHYATSVDDIAIDLSIVDASSPEIVPGFSTDELGNDATSQAVIVAGESWSNPVYVGTPLAHGTYRVAAERAGFDRATSTLVHVGPSRRALAFSSTEERVGKGLSNGEYSLYIERSLIGGEFNLDEPLTVTLASSDPGKVSVPPTVTIPANEYAINFQVTGVDFTDGSPVTVTAFAEGHEPPTTPLSVLTVPATFEFYELSETRGVGEGWDEFLVQLVVPGALDPWDAIPVSDTTVEISIVGASPPGIVPSIFNGSGEEITQYILSNGGSSDWMYVADPTSAGTYRVRVSIPGGVAEATSNEVTVEGAMPEAASDTTFDGDTATAEVRRNQDPEFSTGGVRTRYRPELSGVVTAQIARTPDLRRMEGSTSTSVVQDAWTSGRRAVSKVDSTTVSQ